MNNSNRSFGQRPYMEQAAKTASVDTIPYGATGQVNILYTKNGGFMIFALKRKGDSVDSAPFVANSIDDAINIIRQELERMQT